MIWEDDHWTVHNPVQCSLPGTLWLASKTHFDSFADMPADQAATLAGVIGRVERAILTTGEVGRVHLARWGEGGAHFHLWFPARPVGRLDMANHALPVWEDALPARDQAEIDAIGEKIATALVA
jgi:diadenosine tetraphosphate (Ap4A) HIT family hydrolase